MGTFRFTAGLCALLTLSACDDLFGTGEATPPPVPPSPPPAVEPVLRPSPPTLQRSAESMALSQSFQRIQNDLLAQGLLRTDGGGPDTQFTDTMLARNFVRIALFNEYIDTGSGLRAQANVSQLRRWDQPVRLSVEFGATVPEDQRTQDMQNIRGYVSRLSRVTGLDMDVTDSDPNFHVVVLNEDDRMGFEPRLLEIMPRLSPNTVRAFMDLPRETFCLVLANPDETGNGYGKAVALIRGEHPDLMRLACIHEEIAQGLGLANDSPQARPSIFNDDEEFGLLTTHDELLLKMLYDDRFRAGMSAAEAAPIARIIAAELIGGPA